MGDWNSGGKSAITGSGFGHGRTGKVESPYTTSIRASPLQLSQPSVSFDQALG